MDILIVTVRQVVVADKLIAQLRDDAHVLADVPKLAHDDCESLLVLLVCIYELCDLHTGDVADLEELLRLLAEVYLAGVVRRHVERGKFLDDILVGLLHVFHLLADDVVVLEVHYNLVDAVEVVLGSLSEFGHLARGDGLLLL